MDSHWPVFWASSAVVLVFWGLTPFQAGIFATETISKSVPEPMLVSTGFLPVDQQRETISADYTYSVFGIAWLNNTLPPFMTQEFMVAPFRPQKQAIEAASETWTGESLLYSLDMNCEEAGIVPDPRFLPNETDEQSASFWSSSSGCEVPRPYRMTENQTMGGSGINEIKEFSTLYVGSVTAAGIDSMSRYCPESVPRIFYAAFNRNKKTNDTLPEKPTVLFCEPNFFTQAVNATVTLPQKHVITAIPFGPKLLFPEDKFNIADLLSQMNSETQKAKVRGNVPVSTWPDHSEQLSTTDLSLRVSGHDLAFMAGIAIGAYPRPLEDYLDPETLRRSYEAAYRLVFARALVDIVGLDDSQAEIRLGERTYSIQTVLMVPAFTYLVEGLLAAVVILATALLYLCLFRKRNLRFDPATIAALMSLVMNDKKLTQSFENKDRNTMDELQDAFKDKRFKLDYNGHQSTLTCVTADSGKPADDCNPEAGYTKRAITTDGIRPFEFRFLSSFAFISLQVVALVVFAVLYVKAQPYGLALPSKDRFVRQLLESYIPTVLATFIEPVWVVINRLLCMLQPFEELRRGQAPARRSLSLDYASLPPQLTLWKALRSRHFVLTAVCGMALLANVLAIAFSGLFSERTIGVPHPATFTQPYESMFVSMDGSVGPNTPDMMSSAITSGAFTGGRGQSQFYIAMSNLTSGGKLPPWTDGDFAYIPFSSGPLLNSSHHFRAQTRAFGSRLDCVPLVQGTANTYSYSWDGTLLNENFYYNFTFTMQLDDALPATCTVLGVRNTDNIFITMESCPVGSVGLELLLRTQAPLPATEAEWMLCNEMIAAGWVRNPGPDICAQDKNATIDPAKSTFIGCRPRLLTGLADVLVDSSGYVQEAGPLHNVSEDLESYFRSTPSDLIQQAQSYFVYNLNDDGEGVGAIWHNDSFASDWGNFLISKRYNTSHLIDPSLPAPSFNDSATLLGGIYSYLFAISLGENLEKLLERSPTPDIPSLEGTVIMQETRIFVSKPLFLIAEVILSIYIIVAILVYLRRPGRFLPRLPTTMASVIASFAASGAAEDLRHTSHMSNKERNEYLDRLDRLYGYGSFVGIDGKPHIGIEKQPFVKPSPSEAGRQRTAWSLRSDSSSKDGLITNVQNV
ncbi:hypothetical protein H2201_007290 [Coniosporium apollinis]|uniref:DUF3433 domain containing protein n=2 Tax=Coniosporium TaxID=2810619 RepID=A0ABQ9NR39_9PEZI|nr:hypothetical protein H2199_006164 [Cladosporium sp. JES 115]KAJ9659541.1 hypothetical protein H2201_007290 [Coniosporium apollinis]